MDIYVVARQIEQDRPHRTSGGAAEVLAEFMDVARATGILQSAGGTQLMGIEWHLLLVAMPGAPNSLLFLAGRPGAPCSFLLLVAMPFATSSDALGSEQSVSAACWPDHLMGRVCPKTLNILRTNPNEHL